MELDYALTTDVERLNYIQTLPLQDFDPHTLEYITNYILYGKQPSTKTKDDNYQELKEEQSETLSRYTSPKPQIPWHHPELIQLAQARSHIDTLLTNPNLNTKTIAQLKKLKKEISQDSAPILSAYCPITAFPPTYTTPTPIDISQHIDYTNSFHIKHILILYSKLKQSEHSKYDMDYFDLLIQKSNFPDWQLYMIIRRIDGATANIIGFELAEKYQKFISTTYMSTIMRSIYKKIAKTALQLQIEHKDKQNPQKWHLCTRCNKTLHINNFYNKKPYCKQCEKERRTV